MTTPEHFYSRIMVLTFVQDTMSLHFAYLRQILDLCRDEEPISLSHLYEQQRIPQEKQDVIVINALIDYLPDRWVYRLVLSCFEELADDGCIVLSSVL